MAKWKNFSGELPRECRRLGELGLLGIPQGFRMTRRQLNAQDCFTKWRAGLPRGSENYGVISHGITVMTGQETPKVFGRYLRGQGDPLWRLNGTEGESLIYGAYSLVVLLMMLRRIEDGDLDLGAEEDWLRRNLRARWARLALGASLRPPKAVVYRYEDQEIVRKANLRRFNKTFVHLPAERSALAMDGKNPMRSNPWIEETGLHFLLAGASGFPWNRSRKPEPVSFEVRDWVLSLTNWATRGAGFRERTPAEAWGLSQGERQVLRAWIVKRDLNAAIRLLKWLEPYPNVEGYEVRGHFFDSGSFFWCQDRTKNHVKVSQGTILVAAYDAVTQKCWRLVAVDSRKRGSRQGFAQYLKGKRELRLRARDRPWIHWKLPDSFGSEEYCIVSDATGWRIEAS